MDSSRPFQGSGFGGCHLDLGIARTAERGVVAREDEFPVALAQNAHAVGLVGGGVEVDEHEQVVGGFVTVADES